jgi:hypothetical protein
VRIAYGILVGTASNFIFIITEPPGMPRPAATKHLASPCHIIRFYPDATHYDSNTTIALYTVIWTALRVVVGGIWLSYDPVSF